MLFFSHCTITGTLRSDRNVREVFEQLFPGQIENAEMLIDTRDLEGVLDKRRAYIEKFESAAAKYQYQYFKYQNTQQNCCTNEPKEPMVCAEIYLFIISYYAHVKPLCELLD